MAITGSSYMYLQVNMSSNSSAESLVPFPVNWEDELFQTVIDDFNQSRFTISEPMTILLIVLYVPIFITSLTGNVLVLLVIVPNQRMWSVTNNFLVNLAVADLLVTLLCIPMTLAGKIYKLWIYGDVMCKLTPYLQGVSVASSTFTITAMSMDRCLAILHPMKFRNMRTKRNVRILISLIWITSASLMIPMLVVYKTKTQEIIVGINFQTCSEDWSSFLQRRSYDFSLLCIICLIPAIIVIVSYILMGKRLWVTDERLKEPGETHVLYRGSDKNNMDVIRANRRRLAKMCIVVSIVFVVCWLPYYTVNIYLDFKRDHELLEIIYWSLLIGHLHCITNPILYCFLHKPFRHCVKRMLPCWEGSLGRRPSAYGTNFTKGRKASGLTSIRSRSNRGSNKSSNSSTPTHQICLTPNRSMDINNKQHEDDTNPRPNTLTVEAHATGGDDDDVPDYGATGRVSTRRKVQLVLRHFKRDTCSTSKRNPTFKLVVIENPMTGEEPLPTCSKDS